MFGSVDVNNICNLHCKHCYWWINRKEEEKDLPAEDWRQIIRATFKKSIIFIVSIIGGEPTIRPDIIQVFCEERPKRLCAS
jgi:MoaA/NifB/PqqE/SkfB family radical SAM enzyme